MSDTYGTFWLQRIFGDLSSSELEADLSSPMVASLLLMSESHTLLLINQGIQRSDGLE